jgi:hypothetical protein
VMVSGSRLVGCAHTERKPESLGCMINNYDPDRRSVSGS